MPSDSGETGKPVKALYPYRGSANMSPIEEFSLAHFE
jgi:hypothetical protein